MNDSTPTDDEWADLVADADAIAAEFRDAGWTVHRPDVADVTPAVGEAFGLDVLVPDAEYDTVADAIEDVTFDGSEVYCRVADGVVYLLVVNQSTDEDTAVVVPTYYALDDPAAAGMLAAANAEGRMRTHVRALPREELLTFAHDDPSLFVPDDSVGATLDRDSVSDPPEQE